MNNKIIGRSIYRSIVFVPAIVAPVVIGYTFGNMLNYTYGTVNEFFRHIGLGFLALNWIGSPKLAMYTIIFINIWQWTGFSVVLYLAGLQNIPQELYDAAKIDGAGFFQTITKITFPMLTSTHFSLLILGSIGAIKIFDIVYVMTVGGPAHVTEVLATHVFLENFKLNHTGYASAVSVILLIVALTITLSQLRLYRRVRI
ncbi:MAG: sugar ABC transporter permease [Actinobacteria bacterium]|nr:sugar ABC transporter permease [Actinomycetota bacterium]